MNQSGATDFLQRSDAPYALGAFSPGQFVRQILSLVLLRATVAPPGPLGARGLIFNNEADFWKNRDLLSPAILDSFWITDWFPRVPGLYWSTEARQAREHIEGTAPKHHDLLGSYYEPSFKSDLIEHGGIGCVRLRPKRIDDRLCWFGTAYTSRFCHAGIPIAVPDDLFQKSGIRWGEFVRLTGRIRFLQDVGLEDIGNQVTHARPLVLVVEKLEGRKFKGSTQSVTISPVVMFRRRREWIDYGYPPPDQYTFMNCGTDKEQLLEAVVWMKRYAEQFEGDLITNFDQQEPLLAEAPLSYQRLVEKTYKDDLLKRYVSPSDLQRVKDQRFDIFLSHASEDKDKIARPLYEALSAAGLAVWYDEAVFKIGDNLRRKIEAGLAQCDFAVIVISQHFLNKEWPQRELDGLFGLEVQSGKTKILPIWHDIDDQTITRWAPMLSGRIAGKSSEGIPALVKKVLEVVR